MGKIIDLKQGSDEWLSFRKDGKIGASEAAIIMGVSKFTTPWQLYMRKLGLIPEQEDNAAMSRGRELESSALEEFNARYGYNCVPVVMQHREYPWMIASLDGWDAERRIAVEIKCPGREDHEYAKSGKVPEHYGPQLQHQMAVTGVDWMYYYSHYKGDNYAAKNARNDDYIKDILTREQEFLLRIILLDPPPLCERDYVENHSREWNYASVEFKEAKREKEHAERRYDMAREELIRMSSDRNCKGAGMRVTKSLRKGNIQYTDIPELKYLDLESYRKPPITTWRITEE